MKADSDQAGSGESSVEGLITPAVNLVACTNVRLTFYHEYDYYDGPESGEVQYSTNGQAGPWTTVATYTSDTTGQVILDLTTETAGLANVAFRFYYQGVYDWFWKIDDITVDCLN